jgi:putative sugar O-methyltransferase
MRQKRCPMKPALRYLRHPVRTARSVMALAAARWRTASLLYRGHFRYRNDSRYDLANVSSGFVSHLRDNGSDELLLERICTAYCAALRRERAAASAYRATPWWEQRRKRRLMPVIRALEQHDTGVLQRIYGNFFRDQCSAGLIVPQSLAKDRLAKTTKNLDQRAFLIDFLYRMDFWKEQSGSSFSPKDLAGPLIGNPFGVVLDGTLIELGAEYHHYCAHRVCSLLPADDAAVAEIGGGYGGMAYYLLRDRPGTRYLDFDVPETCALAAYHLLKAFPRLRIVLCGEAEIGSAEMAQAEIALLPVCELANMPACAADIVFSSHAMSDLSIAAMDAYVNDIERVSRGSFLYIGTGSGGRLISEFVQPCRSLRLTQAMRSGWYQHATPRADMVEYLFEADPASSNSVIGVAEEVTRGV